MVDHTSHMFITGPDVIRTVTGEEVDFEDLGGGRAHNTKSGVAHYLADDEADAFSYVKELLSFLPSNNLSEPPAFESPEPTAGAVEDALTDTDLELDAIIPDSANMPYDIHEVITRVLDEGEFLEVHALFAPNIVVGYGRVERPLGGGRRQPADPVRRLPGHRRLGEGGPVRAHLRRVQHPGADLRRRPGLPAGHRAGVERDHPTRREADLRLRRGHRPEDHGDHPQGVRRGVRRDGLQAPGRRPQPGLADRADRGDRRGRAR